jgi:hypothetical protein
VSVVLSDHVRLSEESQGLYRFVASSYESGPPPRTLIMRDVPWKWWIFSGVSSENVGYILDGSLYRLGNRWFAYTEEYAQEMAKLFGRTVTVI